MNAGYTSASIRISACFTRSGLPLMFPIACFTYFLSLSVFVSCSYHSAIPILGHFSSNDRQSLSVFFDLNIPDSARDHTKLYHTLMGFHSIDENIKDKVKSCSPLLSAITTTDFALHHAYGLARLGLPDCKISTYELKEFASKKLAGELSAEELYNVVTAMAEAKLQVDTSSVLRMANKIKAKDTSPTTMAFIFQTVAQLNISKTTLEPFLSSVPDVLNQADELDGRQLFFDKGLYTTALVAKSISDLIIANGGMIGVSEQQLVKLINFIQTRLHSTNLRAAAHLVAALKALATNPHLAPVVLRSGKIMASAGVVDHEHPKIQLQLVTLWGDKSYEPAELKLIAGGLYSIQDPNKPPTLVGPAERGAFQANDNSRYELSLGTSDSSPPPRGLYELEVTAQWARQQEKRQLLGVTAAKIPVRILCEAEVVDPVITLADAANEKHVQDIVLTSGKAYVSPIGDGAIDVDFGYQLTVGLRLVDKANRDTPLTAHQMFLQLTHLDMDHSVTFMFTENAAVGIANAKAYRLYLNPENFADEFDNLSGVYKMELIMGDSFLKNPLVWHMANVRLHFSGEAGSDSARRVAEATDVSQLRTPSVAAMKRSAKPSPLVGYGPTKAKPEIEHMFRPPERRASRPLSRAFTIACGLPLLGLLIGWCVVGINVRNFRCHLSNIIFHLGLVAIFCLYYTYWCRLDMFTTLGYLALLGVPTFLAGHCVLRAQLTARLASSVSAKK